MNVTDLVGLVALLIKVIDTLRFATAKQINGIVTQALVWGAGIAGTFAIAQTQWAAHISVGNGTTLAQQGAWSLVSIGLALSSGGSVLKDFQAAVDSTNTAAIPPLIRTGLNRVSSVLGSAATSPLAGTPIGNHIEATVTAALAPYVAKTGIAKDVSGAAATQPLEKLISIQDAIVGSGLAGTAPAPVDAVHPDFAVSPATPAPPVTTGA